MRRRLIPLAIAVSVVATAGSCGERGGLTSRPDGPLLQAEPLVYDQRPWTGVSGIEVVSAQVLGSGSIHFGGWSGLRMRDGVMTAVSDRGYWLQVPLEADGQLRETEARLGPLIGPDGEPLRDDDQRDAEDLVALPDGGWLVSFERNHRLWLYPPGAATPFSTPPVALPAPDDIGGLPYNGGIEAMALLPDGRLLLLAEGADGDTVARGWITAAPLSPTPQWQTLTLAGDGHHRPTAAAVADGALWVLERSWGLLTGFSNQLRRIPLDRVQAGGTLAGPVVARFDAPPVADNFEGLDAVADRLIALTDDNYNGLQRTLLLMFRPVHAESSPEPS